MKEYEEQAQDIGKSERTLTLVSEKGHPEIVVFEKIKNRREDTIGSRFPP